ncbi:MAG: hypothetical protein JW944_11300 [Deltaproteobacteria bacterium]|nr:hypothetical protein [Deltaproteobacteria bacterium]
MHDKDKRHLRTALIAPCIIILYTILSLSYAGARTEHEVYFADTAYELNVYRIYGQQPGNTLMLIGGIQGNEPGGFLSADLYADMSLEQGNLIVVPRANFYSIILNERGPNGDMNRKFTNEEIDLSIEDKIVNILKKLISESDYLLNLHDGSGYYYPEYIDEDRNPNRFGQSVIADCSEFTDPESGNIINLEKMAQDVINEVNQYISNDLYKFNFNNTRTADEDSAHKEQRKSATYYAMSIHHIPAFGVESSKYLPSTDLKVWFHNLIINAFMKRFGIIPQSPGLALDSPNLKYLVVSINGKTPLVIKKNEHIIIGIGDTINISHIEANYERGLSLDILDHGDLNDLRKDFQIFKDTEILIRRDNNIFGEIPVRVLKNTSSELNDKESPAPGSVDSFIVEALGRRLLLFEGETLVLVKGDKMKIIDIFPFNLSGVQVNFKGFVGDRLFNTGEDRGYDVDTANDLMQRYSIDQKGETYPVVASKGDNIIGGFNVRLKDPRLAFLSLKINGAERILLGAEDSVTLSANDSICVEKIATNLYNSSEVSMSINGKKLANGDCDEIDELCTLDHNEISFHSGSLIIGKVFIDIEGN